MQNESCSMHRAGHQSSPANLQFAFCSLHFAIPLLLCGPAAALLIATAPASAQTPNATESLGDQLLEDLAPGMFDDGPAAPRDERQPTAPTHLGPNLNFRMPGPLDHGGEDIGGASPAAPWPLVAARDGMNEARSLLALAAQRDSLPQAREVQQQVIARLDELIEELAKQCQGGDCQSGEQPSPGEQPQPKPGDSAAQAGQGSTAARDSTTRLGDSPTHPVEKVDRENLMKALWGHLPERDRQQMLQSFSDEFLPEYELEIEKYYRRLSEETDEPRPR